MKGWSLNIDNKAFIENLSAGNKTDFDNFLDTYSITLLKTISKLLTLKFYWNYSQ